MQDMIGAEGGLLVMGFLLLNASIFLYIITGKPRLRYLILLDLSLLFWMIILLDKHHIRRATDDREHGR